MFVRMFSFALAVTMINASPSNASELKDIKAFVKTDFHEKIEGLKTGLYCKALSCEFEIDSFTAEEKVPQTYQLVTTAWLKGTIPGLKGSAKRTLHLDGVYTKGTCIVKDIKPVSDVTENNNGWGASKIESVFKGIDIPKNVILAKEDCVKVDKFIGAATQSETAAH